MASRIRRHIAPIVLALLCIVMHVCGCSYRLGEGLEGRMLYPFCHVNVWHLLGNLWCIFLIARSNYRDRWWMYILSFFICVTVPEGDVPTAGLSGLCYALMGMLSWQAAERWKFHAWCLGFMSIGFFFPNHINNLLHIWTYTLGVLAGFFIYECDKKMNNKARIDRNVQPVDKSMRFALPRFCKMNRN